MADAQAKLTDLVRESIMAYIYSEDDLLDALYLEKVFNYLSQIDAKFQDVDNELKEKRRKIVQLQVELRKAAMCNSYDPTEGIKLFDEE